jgi:hypothetical protein
MMALSQLTVLRAIEGDLAATNELTSAPRDEVVRLSRSMGTLTVTADAAARVLRQAAARSDLAAAAAGWSRLARNGLLQPGSRDHFDVDYDPEQEDAIAEAVLRLDDLPEDPIGADELHRLLAALGPAGGSDGRQPDV